MANTIPNLSLPHNQWTDLTQPSGAYPGYVAGGGLTMCNLGKSTIIMHIGPAEPTDLSGYVYLDARGATKQTPYFWFVLDAGESALWVKSISGPGLVNIQL